MNKDQYIKLVNDLITNSSSYVKLRLIIQSKLSSLIKKYHCSNFSDDTTRKKLTCYNGIASKLYGLPKIHKPTSSINPINASHGAPTSFLASFLQIFWPKHSVDNEYIQIYKYIKDSFEVSIVHLDAYLNSINNKWEIIAHMTKILF